jgi:hypothetical protein
MATPACFSISASGRFTTTAATIIQVLFGDDGVASIHFSTLMWRQRDVYTFSWFVCVYCVQSEGGLWLIAHCEYHTRKQDARTNTRNQEPGILRIEDPPSHVPCAIRHVTCNTHTGRLLLRL